jgi:hypothetical protein
MKDPIFHGSAQPFLPEDHRLLVDWPEHDEGTDEISCSRCGKGIYHRHNGTIFSWFETGFVLEEEDGQYETFVFCLTCAAGMDYWIPQVNERYWFHDNGQPQFDKADGS